MTAVPGPDSTAPGPTVPTDQPAPAFIRWPIPEEVRRAAAWRLHAVLCEGQVAETPAAAKLLLEMERQNLEYGPRE
jgi:hypothetical protein